MISIQDDKLSLYEFLFRAAREVARGDWVFTGFHWPVIAAHLARALFDRSFFQVFEAGVILDRPARMIPTSTTDYAAYAGSEFCSLSTADVLLGLASRLDIVLLDAANVDVRGHVNSWGIGPVHQPRIRMPGGGGAADIAHAAKRLVLLHGGVDLRRIQERVEHTTARPGPRTDVSLITRFGVVRLGADPSLLEYWGPTSAAFIDHLATIGVRVDEAQQSELSSGVDPTPFESTLAEAAGRGYKVAQQIRGASASEPERTF